MGRLSSVIVFALCLSACFGYSCITGDICQFKVDGSLIVEGIVRDIIWSGLATGYEQRMFRSNVTLQEDGKYYVRGGYISSVLADVYDNDNQFIYQGKYQSSSYGQFDYYEFNLVRNQSMIGKPFTVEEVFFPRKSLRTTSLFNIHTYAQERSQSQYIVDQLYNLASKSYDEEKKEKQSLQQQH